MQAYGLSEMTYAKSFMQKVMDGGIINPKSLANQLADPRFKAFATEFNFGDKGSTVTATAAVATDTTAAYVEQSLEDNAGQQNQGAQLALYFQRMAPNIKSGMDILADKDLLQFVQTAYSLPANTGATVDVQAKLIESKVKMADLQDPKKVAGMVNRFAVLWDAANSDASTNPAVALLSPSSSSAGGFNDTSLLGNVQQLYTRY